MEGLGIVVLAMPGLLGLYALWLLERMRKSVESIEKHLLYEAEMRRRREEVAVRATAAASAAQ